MRVVTYRRITMAIKIASKVGVFLHCCFVLLLPWQPPGQYGASSCLMVASRGFRCSPGHDALGDMSSLAATHLHGHQNGQ
jgi:hypothetical protein